MPIFSDLVLSKNMSIRDQSAMSNSKKSSQFGQDELQLCSFFSGHFAENILWLSLFIWLIFKKRFCYDNYTLFSGGLRKSHENGTMTMIPVVFPGYMSLVG